jgi:hypothetical protein
MEPCKILINNLPITDWIQAIGALVAIIGALIAFLKLFKRDLDKQKQIDSLYKMAEQSEIQANQLINLAEYINKSNSLLSQQVSLIQEILISSEKDNEKTQERIEVENKLRKNQNLPRFEFLHGSGNLESFVLDFENKGKIGKIKGIESLEDNKISNVNLLNAVDSNIDENGRLRIRIMPNSEIKTPQSANINFRILFSDIEGNDYYQLVSGNMLKPKVSFPSEFKPIGKT